MGPNPQIDTATLSSCKIAGLVGRHCPRTKNLTRSSPTKAVTRVGASVSDSMCTSTITSGHINHERKFNLLIPDRRQQSHDRFLEKLRLPQVAQVWRLQNLLLTL